MNVSSSTWATAAGATSSAQRGHGANQKTMDAVATELGLSGGDLRKALDGGQSMTDLAQQAGVAKDDLVRTIAATLPSTGPDGATVDTTRLATRIADHVRGERPGGPPPSSGRNSGAASGAASGTAPGSALGQGIDALSSALGISADDLMQRLTDGSGISDLLAGNPDLAAQLSASGAKGALVDGYA